MYLTNSPTRGISRAFLVCPAARSPLPAKPAMKVRRVNRSTTIWKTLIGQAVLPQNYAEWSSRERPLPEPLESEVIVRLLCRLRKLGFRQIAVGIHRRSGDANFIMQVRRCRSPGTPREGQDFTKPYILARHY